MSIQHIALFSTVLLVVILVAATMFNSTTGANGRTSGRSSGRNPSTRRSRPRPGAVEIHVTDPSRRLVKGDVIEWTDYVGAEAKNAQSTADAVVRVLPSERYQKVVGFGGAFTDAACYMFNEMEAGPRAVLFNELFSPNEMALNLNRTCIGSSDYATHLYSYDEGEPDPELTRFSIDHDRKYILPIIREARAINPDITLFSSPWSPPGWMKANGSMLGGNMQRQYMAPYANYFVKFLNAYAEAGVPVQAVTVQNEVDTDQDGRMPACAWPQEYEVDFVRHHLGPAFRKEKLDTQIWIIDHNYNLWGRALGSLDTEGLRDYASAIAWHGYVGDPARMTLVHNSYPDIDMYWTEGGPDYTNPDYQTDWCKWSRSFTGNLRNWCRGITVWNLALDEAGRPNIGPFPCGGLVTVNSTTKEVTKSGQFHAIAHYSRFIKRDAVRIGSLGNHQDLSHVAFVNPDGGYVLVLTNSGAPRTVDVDLYGWCATVSLEGDSVVTLTWKPGQEA